MSIIFREAYEVRISSVNGQMNVDYEEYRSAKAQTVSTPTTATGRKILEAAKGLATKLKVDELTIKIKK